MALHKLGRKHAGQRVCYFGVLSDEEFQPIADQGLPEGWFAIHVEPSECDEPISHRVAEIRKMPHFDGASWRDDIRLAGVEL